MVEGRFNVNVLDPGWTRKVADTSESALRAHRIALTYSHLAELLDTAIHGAPPVDAEGKRRPVVNANWFHFALWGTLTVSQNIGNERAPQRLNSGLAAPLRRRLTPSILRIKASDGQRLGRALAWGQRLIFLSVCGAMQKSFETPLLPLPPAGGEPLVLNEVSSESFRQGPGLVGDFLGDLGSTDRKELKEQRHVEPMRRAFALYQLASQLGHDAEAERQRSQLVLGANLLLTAVEQDLVDPALSIVVDLVPNSAAEAVSWRLAKVAERVRGVPPHLSYLMLLNMRTGERRAIDTVWSRLMTDQVLVMALPTETLRLGRDIPPRHRGSPYYPAALRRFPERHRGTATVPDDRPPTTDERVERAILDIGDRVRSFDRTVRDGRGSAARDWRRWDERMNWALTLMRSRQQDETLYWRPYSVRDEQRIETGDLPGRGADPSALEVCAPLEEWIIPQKTASREPER